MSERGKAERLAPQGARKTGRGQHARENLGSAEASVVREMRAGARRRRREKTDAVQALHRLAQGEIANKILLKLSDVLSILNEFK